MCFLLLLCLLRVAGLSRAEDLHGTRVGDAFHEALHSQRPLDMSSLAGGQQPWSWQKTLPSSVPRET